MTKYDTAMLQTAETFAKQSQCKRKQVGAVLARDGRILATGYNGTLPGKPNDCECTDGTTSEFVLHAEQNLISYCARKGIPTEGTTLYITHSPCKTCSKLIAAVGITSVIFQDYYKDTDGIEFLQECGISITKA